MTAAAFDAARYRYQRRRTRDVCPGSFGGGAVRHRRKPAAGLAARRILAEPEVRLGADRAGLRPALRPPTRPALEVLHRLGGDPEAVRGLFDGFHPRDRRQDLSFPLAQGDSGAGGGTGHVGHRSHERSLENGAAPTDLLENSHDLRRCSVPVQHRLGASQNRGDHLALADRFAHHHGDRQPDRARRRPLGGIGLYEHGHRRPPRHALVALVVDVALVVLDERHALAVEQLTEHLQRQAWLTPHAQAHPNRRGRHRRPQAALSPPPGRWGTPGPDPPPRPRRQPRELGSARPACGRRAACGSRRSWR